MARSASAELTTVFTGARLALIGALVFASVVAGRPASAAEPRFDVPQGFVVLPETEPASSQDWRPILTVQPEENPFSSLSSLSLREVIGDVEDPDVWLKDRLTIDMPSDAEVGSLLDSPDSPFADSAFDMLRRTIPQLFESLREFGKIGAELCDPPQTAYNAVGSLREMYCTFQVGPLRQFIVLRLQEVNGRWYYTEAKAANERRIRDLVAIADTFRD